MLKIANVRMTDEEWMQLAGGALQTGIVKVREAARSAPDPATRAAFDKAADYMEGILDQRPRAEK